MIYPFSSAPTQPSSYGWLALKSALEQGNLEKAKNLTLRVSHVYQKTILQHLEKQETQAVFSLIKIQIEKEAGFLSKLGYHPTSFSQLLYQQPPAYLASLQDFLFQLSLNFEKWQEKCTPSTAVFSLITQIQDSLNDDTADDKRLETLNQLKRLPEAIEPLIQKITTILHRSPSEIDARQKLEEIKNTFEKDKTRFLPSQVATLKIQELEHLWPFCNLTLFSSEEQTLLQEAPFRIQQWLSQHSAISRSDLEVLKETIANLASGHTGSIRSLFKTFCYQFESCCPEPSLSLENLNAHIDEGLLGIELPEPVDPLSIKNNIEQELNASIELALKRILASLSESKILNTLLYPLLKFYLSSISHNLIQDLFLFLENQDKDNFNPLIRSCLNLAHDSYEDLLNAYKEAKTKREIHEKVSTFTYGSGWCAKEVERRFLYWFLDRFMPSFNPLNFFNKTSDSLQAKYPLLYYFSLPLLLTVKTSLFVAKPLFYLLRKIHNIGIFYFLIFFNAFPKAFHEIKQQLGVFGGNTPIFDCYVLNKIKQFRALSEQNLHSFFDLGFSVPQEDIQTITKISFIFFDLLEREISPIRENRLSGPVELFRQGGLADGTLLTVSTALGGVLRKSLSKQELLEVVYFRLQDLKKHLTGGLSLHPSQSQALENKVRNLLFKTIEAALFSIHPRALHALPQIKTRCMGLFSLLKNGDHFDTLAHGGMSLCIKA